MLWYVSVKTWGYESLKMQTKSAWCLKKSDPVAWLIWKGSLHWKVPPPFLNLVYYTGCQDLLAMDTWQVLASTSSRGVPRRTFKIFWGAYEWTGTLVRWGCLGWWSIFWVAWSLWVCFFPIFWQMHVGKTETHVGKLQTLCWSKFSIKDNSEWPGEDWQE